MLGVSIFEFRVGSAQVSQAIVKALGGGTVASVCAAFASDLLGPAWLAAAIGVVAPWIAVGRDDPALATQSFSSSTPRLKLGACNYPFAPLTQGRRVWPDDSGPAGRNLPPRHGKSV